MKYDIKKIADIIASKAIIRGNNIIKRILLDSRSLYFPEDSLFFALKTSTNNGHKYLKELYGKGVRSFVISDTNIDVNKYPQADFLIVKDVLDALQAFAGYHRRQFFCPIIAITGSNGKTIIKEWLWQLLRNDYKITRSPRSYNSQVGVPLSIWELNEKTELGIFEAGISMPLEMERLQKIISPNIGILTNIGEAHKENFASDKSKLEEKIKLFTSCSTIISCKDQTLCSEVLNKNYGKNKIYEWSNLDKKANLYIEIDENTLKYNNNIIKLPFTDKASIQNICHCIAFLTSQKIDVKNLNEKIKTLEPVAMRLEVKEGKNNCVLINDSYNSDLKALEIALDFQKRRSLNQDYKKTVILSDILQTGQNLQLLYVQVANLLKKYNIEHLIGIGKDLYEYKKFFKLDSHFFLETETLLSSGLLNNLKNENILIKGSRSFHFEKIADKLSKKIHDTILKVDLNQLIENFNYFRSLLKPETKIIGMVKADAYGAGALEVAQTLQANSCYAVAVAVLDEGVELRKGGIIIPIFVMNPQVGSFSNLSENNLEPEIYNFDILNKFIIEAEHLGIKDYPIHIKLDTGMHRLGFEEKDLDKIIEILKNHNCFRIKSIFSHLVGSDDIKFDNFTREQLNRFSDMSSYIQKHFNHKIMRHILNSAGIERFTEYQFDMVRLGIGMYGLSTLKNPAIKNISSLKTIILNIRKIKAGDSIGYSRKEILKRDSIIATIPIGYADGINRHLGNRNGEVIIHNKKAPIIGNVCMDACMIDITDIPQAKEEDIVTIFGEGMPVETLAKRLDTISYEILTSVSPRVKRIYYYD